jgi:hypothetical protein
MGYRVSEGTSHRSSWGILPQTPVFSLRSARCQVGLAKRATEYLRDAPDSLRWDVWATEFLREPVIDLRTKYEKLNGVRVQKPMLGRYSKIEMRRLAVVGICMFISCTL